MENKVIKDETNPGATGPLADENAGGRWHAPVFSVFEMAGAHGDPTISDDGLGDGLFS
jgi:hypothetical protein